MQQSLNNCIAPAKINLFLHVTGRRADGYHLLQSAFQLIDLADHLDFVLRKDGRIVRTNPLPGVAPEHDLTVRAAQLLQDEATAQGQARPGVDITLDKHIPMGGGLGGGSSDAATSLLALNRLWNLNLPRKALARIGLKLGADVPFFIFGRNAFAQGIGEELSVIETPKRWFAVIHPGVSIPTAAIFSASELTRDTKPIRISDFSGNVNSETTAEAAAGGGVSESGFAEKFEINFGHNDLEPVARARFPEVGRALEWLGQFGQARMSGSGACVFCAFSSQADAQSAVSKLPEHWTGWVCATLSEHPLRNWADDASEAG